MLIMNTEYLNQSDMTHGGMVLNSSFILLRHAGDTQYKDLYLQMRYITGLFCYPVICFIGLLGNIISIIGKYWYMWYVYIY